MINLSICAIATAIVLQAGNAGGACAAPLTVQPQGTISCESAKELLSQLSDCYGGCKTEQGMFGYGITSCNVQYYEALLQKLCNRVTTGECNKNGNCNEDTEDCKNGNCGVTIPPTATPTQVPTKAPTAVETPTATVAPTKAPTATAAPTAAPTQEPTAAPTQEPTAVPTKVPTAVPTIAPTAVPTAAPTPTAVPTKEPTATPMPTKVSEAGGEMTRAYQYGLRITELVNEQRIANGLKPVEYSAALSEPAQVRVVEIQKSFAHTRPDGRYFSSVLRDFGIGYRTCGENIAWGQRSPEEVVTAWMNSPGHRANILNAGYTKLGVGYAQNERGVNYYTQLFTN